MEQWKKIKIKGELSRYSVSDLGRVRNDLTGRLLEQTLNKPHKGYLSVVLMFANEKKFYTVHRLVAMAFCPNPNKKPQVNHEDGDKLNNHATNLNWMTARENVQHYHANHRFNQNKQ
jgi:hypothetical protein